MFQKTSVRLFFPIPNMLKLSVEKTDKKDAEQIAGLFKQDLVAAIFMPPADIRQLRELM